MEIEYNDHFRLYMVTSLANPHYLPSTFIKVNLINFAITFKCLFEQLLSQVVLRERPELEHERVTLLESITSDSLSLRELENKTLTSLSGSGSGNSNILDDSELVDVLKQTKQMSIDIEKRLEKSFSTEKSLNAARLRFAPAATRAAVLYFTVQNLSELNVMYQFSLAWFYSVFQSCLGDNHSASSENDDDDDEASDVFDEYGDRVDGIVDRDLRKLAASTDRRSSRLITSRLTDVHANLHILNKLYITFLLFDKSR